MPSCPEPSEVFILLKVDNNLSFVIAENEKVSGGSWKGYSPYKMGFAFSGIFSLSLFPM